MKKWRVFGVAVVAATALAACGTPSAFSHVPHPDGTNLVLASSAVGTKSVTCTATGHVLQSDILKPGGLASYLASELAWSLSTDDIYVGSGDFAINTSAIFEGNGLGTLKGSWTLRHASVPDMDGTLTATLTDPYFSSVDGVDNTGFGVIQGVLEGHNRTSTLVSNVVGLYGFSEVGKTILLIAGPAAQPLLSYFMDGVIPFSPVKSSNVNASAMATAKKLLTSFKTAHSADVPTGGYYPFNQSVSGSRPC